MKTLINICGTPRCGSTMIDMMLGNDPRGFSLGEVYAWFRPFRTHHFHLKCLCNTPDCPWPTLKQFKEKHFHQKAFDALDVDFLVDSSTQLNWVIDNNIQAQKSGFRVVNLLVYKEPISLYHSYWKRGASIETARDQRYIPYHLHCFESGLPFIAINYNTFVSDVTRHLEQLCTWLGIPYFTGKENFWEKRHHQAFGSLGTRRHAMAGDCKVRTRESYDKAFMDLVPEIEAQDRNNPTLQRVVQRLEYLEAQTRINKGPVENGPLKKPLWYHYQNLKQHYQRRFPQKSKYEY